MINNASNETALKIFKVTEEIKKYWLDPNSNTDHMCCLVKDDTYFLMKEAAGVKPMITAFGILIKRSEDIQTEPVVMSSKGYDIQTKTKVLFHRLATNGEWLAQGKKGSERKRFLLVEAEGFADMCSGYSDVYETIVEEYLKQWPTGKESNVGEFYYTSDLSLIL